MPLLLLKRKEGISCGYLVLYLFRFGVRHSTFSLSVYTTGHVLSKTVVRMEIPTTMKFDLSSILHLLIHVVQYFSLYLFLLQTLHRFPFRNLVDIIRHTSLNMFMCCRQYLIPPHTTLRTGSGWSFTTCATDVAVLFLVISEILLFLIYTFSTTQVFSGPDYPPRSVIFASCAIK